MYTSGSTGTPKGVMMSHGNLLASVRSFPIRLGNLKKNKEIWVGYLPLAHVLELAAELGCIMGGIRIGYSTPQTIVDNSTAIKRGKKGDLRVLKPTIMAAVPLILERFSKAVREKISKTNWFKQALFKKAYEYKLAKVRSGRTSYFLDRILFKKISRAVLGGKVRYIVCGASLLSEEVQEFMQVCLAPVRQAYALTETCAGGTAQYEFETDTQVCGSVIASAELRLVDWVEGGYRITDKPNPRGEVYLGGDNVTLGYYKMPEKTLEDFCVIDGVRYFATGDIGEMLPNGNLKIIDRKKDLVKLQGGEYISLSRIEVLLKLLPFVENCCVCANPLKTSCVVLICPNIHKIIVS
jgi:long-chain acyl-CoA synthetase